MSVSLILLEIKSGDVNGDATVAGYSNQISVESFTWGVKSDLKGLNKPSKGENPKTPIEFKELSLKKQFDSASMGLLTMMNGDKQFDAVLRFIDPSTGTKSGSTVVKADAVLEVELKGCYIESISLDINDSGKAVAVSESVTLSFNQEQRTSDSSLSSIDLSYRGYNQITRARGAAMNVHIDPVVKGKPGPGR